MKVRVVLAVLAIACACTCAHALGLKKSLWNRRVSARLAKETRANRSGTTRSEDACSQCNVDTSDNCEPSASNTDDYIDCGKKQFCAYPDYELDSPCVNCAKCLFYHTLDYCCNECGGVYCKSNFVVGESKCPEKCAYNTTRMTKREYLVYTNTYILPDALRRDYCIDASEAYGQAGLEIVYDDSSGELTTKLTNKVCISCQACILGSTQQLPLVGEDFGELEGYIEEVLERFEKVSMGIKPKTNEEKRCIELCGLQQIEEGVCPTKVYTAETTHAGASASTTQAVAGADTTQAVAGADTTQAVAGADTTQAIAGADTTQAIADADALHATQAAEGAEPARTLCPGPNPESKHVNAVAFVSIAISAVVVSVMVTIACAAQVPKRSSRLSRGY